LISAAFAAPPTTPTDKAQSNNITMTGGISSLLWQRLCHVAALAINLRLAG
jgi:hypothetical protein